MKDEKYIEQLVERFMDGETTLEEERELYRLMDSDSLDGSLRRQKEMFLAFASIDSRHADAAMTAVVRNGWRKAKMLRVAAVAVLVLASAVMVGVYRANNYSEAYFYARHVTDSEVIMSEVASTMASIGSDSETLVDSQLRGILGDGE